MGRTGPHIRLARPFGGSRRGIAPRARGGRDDRARRGCTQYVLRAISVIGGHIEWGREHGWDYVAALVVARARLKGPEARASGVDTSTFEAFGRWLVPPPSGSFPLLALDEEDVVAWEGRVRQCGGWRAVLEGSCSP